MRDPLQLTDPPLERWTAGPGGALQRCVLSQAERADAVARIDLLDLHLTRPALTVPLASGNRQTASISALAPEAVARSLCAIEGVEPDWF